MGKEGPRILILETEALHRICNSFPNPSNTLNISNAVLCLLHLYQQFGFGSCYYSLNSFLQMQKRSCFSEIEEKLSFDIVQVQKKNQKNMVSTSYKDRIAYTNIISMNLINQLNLNEVQCDSDINMSISCFYSNS